jgi:hypothetical protein
MIARLALCLAYILHMHEPSKRELKWMLIIVALLAASGILAIFIPVGAR